MRSRLFLKVYATLLLTLAVVAIASFMFVRMGAGRAGSRLGRAGATISLPRCCRPTPIRRPLEIVLDRLAAAFDGDIAVFGPDGSPIAAAGKDAAARTARTRPRSTPRRRPARLRGAACPTGAMSPPGSICRSARVAAMRSRYLALVAAVTGLAAYPVVRHLTRRLESLRGGVEAWGEGALDRRVAVEGKDEVAAVAADLQPGGRPHRAAGRGAPVAARQRQPRTALAAGPAAHGDRSLRAVGQRGAQARDRAQPRRARRAGRGDPAGQPARPWRQARRGRGRRPAGAGRGGRRAQRRRRSTASRRRCAATPGC